MLSEKNHNVHVSDEMKQKIWLKYDASVLLVKCIYLFIHSFIYLLIYLFIYSM